MTPFLDEIKQLALQAGEILRSGYEQPISIQHKGMVDLVTEIDHRSEAFILQYLKLHYLGHTFIAEESGRHEGHNEHAWYIDPLDGTINYAHGVPFFSVSIAYAFRGQLQLGVIYDPMRNECFSAERGHGAWLNDKPIYVSKTSLLTDSLLVTGFANISHRTDIEVRTDNIDNFKRLMQETQGIRRLGSAALDLAYVACGRLDGYWEYGIHSWDIAAGALIVEEAGGKVTHINGDAHYFTPPYPILAAPPTLHAAILQNLDRIV